ncbi:unnamed protein product, partial [Cylindrotheca closterium]
SGGKLVNCPVLLLRKVRNIAKVKEKRIGAPAQEKLDLDGVDTRGVKDHRRPSLKDHRRPSMKRVECTFVMLLQIAISKVVSLLGQGPKGGSNDFAVNEKLFTKGPFVHCKWNIGLIQTDNPCESADDVMETPQSVTGRVTGIAGKQFFFTVILLPRELDIVPRNLGLG